MKKEIIRINVEDHKMKMIIEKPERQDDKVPGILWIHGGGYVLGMASMVDFSCGKMLGKKDGAVVVSPGYTLAFKNPYPAALNDCYRALEYMWDNADDLGIDREKIVVGGESAGGGLAVAVCLKARDEGRIKIAMQLPLYPMLDCNDTASSVNNHGKVWNTRRNHWGWKKYLGELYGNQDVSPYASPARATDYSNLPPCYTFVSVGEPFFMETVSYVKKLNAAGVYAEADIYDGDVHAFDMLQPLTAKARKARKKLCEAYRRLMG